LRLLFFDALVLVLFDGDTFILPVTSVFTRIRSGAVWECRLWRWRGSKSNLLNSSGDNINEGGGSLDLIAEKCNYLK
jgi:hypothetical protein